MPLTSECGTSAPCKRASDRPSHSGCLTKLRRRREHFLTASDVRNTTYNSRPKRPSVIQKPIERQSLQLLPSIAHHFRFPRCRILNYPHPHRYRALCRSRLTPPPTDRSRTVLLISH